MPENHKPRWFVGTPLILSIAQLLKNYVKEGSDITIDNFHDSMFGGFAFTSETAEMLSETLGINYKKMVNDYEKFCNLFINVPKSRIYLKNGIYFTT